ncbi:MAG TPA: hypothetical protein VK533_14160 [Sphingomonas sp.]|uniref:hypothetical protein n=1 Tax=Sphingomonas sp. TaxID=28214 RepID=UPI002D0E7F30|nr:hypothetical protein [Sphingomonas sp.]HMI20677.1 hypothetical protein [Sphingomonas sp.]
MKDYLRRIWPTAWYFAKWIFALEAALTVLDFFNGRVGGGTAANIALRICGAFALMVLLSFIIAALEDWRARRNQA